MTQTNWIIYLPRCTFHSVIAGIANLRIESINRVCVLRVARSDLLADKLRRRGQVQPRSVAEHVHCARASAQRSERSWRRAINNSFPFHRLN